MRDTTAQDQAGYPGSVEWLYAWLRRHPWLVDGTLAVIVLAGAARRLPAGLSLAAYRIVQEALTNVRKHAGPETAAEVTLRYGQDELLVRVTDDGRCAAGRPGYGAVPTADLVGHGLAGMRERAAMYGGTVQAGPRPGGGFEVTARLPLPATAPTADSGGTLSRGAA
jgi:signal transduction histidine kinase